MPVLPFRAATLLLVCLVATSCGGCIVSLTTAQYALADVRPLGWVTEDIRPAPWCDVVEKDPEAAGPTLVVSTAAVQHWPLPIGPGIEPIGVRYVAVPLDSDYLPPDGLALPAAAGVTAEELALWVQGLTRAERAQLVELAQNARKRLVARREPPPPMEDVDWGKHVRGVGRPDEILPRSAAVVDVIKVADGAFIAAFRTPRSISEEATGWNDGLSPVSMNTPPPQPPATGPPHPGRYHAAVVLPLSFETSGGDRAARAATGLLVSPAAVAYDAVVVGFSLLPLALTVAVVAAIA